MLVVDKKWEKKYKMYRTRVFVICLKMMRRNDAIWTMKKKIHTKRYVVYKEEKKEKRGRSVWVGGHTSPSVYIKCSSRIYIYTTVLSILLSTGSNIIIT
jgi:hypothetical protein